jgi:hypothetical protein
MADNQNQGSDGQETMQGNLRDKPKDASSFADNQYAGDTEPASGDENSGEVNISQQGGGSGSSKQGGNTGSTPNASS